ncbi:DUF423 domain-containing protein [Halomonas sp. 18H]|uniref:DUF423 domain-containing protein n=1 Tax=Halomonas almeriensis TaxID=308163 RepID=UPI002230F559|nr:MULTISPECIES: DUF423 domain-containing protein [Halomonas]MCW4151987.1 DUF423 domain-containing protein [Halomonas sp. 18H]MDN3552429.1 DUF423 domain-containing protein [Halomonas almeriensis]
MADRLWWIMAALSGALMVVMGAWGAHGLTEQLTPRLLEGYQTGVRYQAWHTLAILAVLAWRAARPLAGQRLILTLWALGMLLFSGSLYGLALSELAWLGPITPLGGILLIAGWLSLAGSLLFARR